MKKGSIIRYFPGNNTPDGYFSYFESILPWKRAQRIIIIKGGPGVGKSTMIRKITKELVDRGLNIELLHCTADSNSLDGLIIKDYSIAVVDGTAPHMIDPKFPGCVDEIVNLGDYWNEAELYKQKERIFLLQEKVKHLYARVYNYLKAAKIIFNNLEQAYSTLANRRLIEAKTEEIIEDVFKGVKRRDKISLQRRMFASGITPEGSIHFLDELFDKVSKRFILVGNPGTGKSAVLKKIEELGTSKGLDMDIFYCPMNNKKIDHLLIIDLDIGFITSVRPHMILNTRENDVFIDMNSVLDCSRLKDIEEDISQDSLLAWSLFDKAVKTLIQVKQTRDELEGIYSSNMNFQVAEKVGEQILAKILSYI